MSHSTTHDTPLVAAASTTRRAYSGLALYPSKKCSASKKTRRPAAARKATDSPTMATPSSSVVCRASVTWKSQLLPTMHTVDVSTPTSACRVGSTSTLPAGRRVEPNATSWAVESDSSAGARRKNSASLGLACG